MKGLGSPSHLPEGQGDHAVCAGNERSASQITRRRLRSPCKRPRGARSTGMTNMPYSGSSSLARNCCSSRPPATSYSQTGKDHTPSPRRWLQSPTVRGLPPWKGEGEAKLIRESSESQEGTSRPGSSEGAAGQDSQRGGGGAGHQTRDLQGVLRSCAGASVTWTGDTTPSDV